MVITRHSFVRYSRELDSAVLVDSALAEDLANHPKVTAIEGNLPDVFEQVSSGSLDVVLCISVLEHLWNPLATLQECNRVVRAGGLCLFNVPSWRGKRFLEYSAFRLGRAPGKKWMTTRTITM